MSATQCGPVGWSPVSVVCACSSLLCCALQWREGCWQGWNGTSHGVWRFRKVWCRSCQHTHHGCSSSSKRQRSASIPLYLYACVYHMRTLDMFQARQASVTCVSLYCRFCHHCNLFNVYACSVDHAKPANSNHMYLHSAWSFCDCPDF